MSCWVKEEDHVREKEIEKEMNISLNNYNDIFKEIYRNIAQINLIFVNSKELDDAIKNVFSIENKFYLGKMPEKGILKDKSDLDKWKLGQLEMAENTMQSEVTDKIDSLINVLKKQLNIDINDK